MTNLLPLETFRRLFGLDPLHFWGWGGATWPVTSPCAPILGQYSWQSADFAARSEVAEAIQTAEQRLADHLGYDVAPVYRSETRPFSPSSDGWGRWWSVPLSSGYIQAAGVEARTLIATANAVYSDADGDGVTDTFTATAPTTVTDAGEIAVYVSAADRFDGAGFSADVGEHWRIAPVTARISGGVVTVTGPSWLCARPVLYEGFATTSTGLEPATVGNYVRTVDLYRRYTDENGTTATTSQAMIVWETRPCHGWHCCCGGCGNVSSAFSGSPFDPAATAVAVARVALRDAEHGVVGLAEAAYNAATGVWSAYNWSLCDVPDRATVRTLAGYPLGADHQMDPFWQLVVARLAAAELARPLAACGETGTANRELGRWQFDLARSSGANDEAYGAVSASDLDNPLGTRRGHVQAWRIIKQRQQLRGFLA